jgi:hypothetical protein
MQNSLLWRTAITHGLAKPLRCSRTQIAPNITRKTAARKAQKMLPVKRKLEKLSSGHSLRHNPTAAHVRSVHRRRAL